MDGYLLITVLILTGGTIAYVGDRIGMRVGKKRLTLFGIRPRYTSILITIITGLLISGATIAVLVAISADVRTALFQMKEIKEDLAVTKDTLEQTQDEYRMVSAQIEAKANEYSELQDRYERLIDDYDDLSDEYENLFSSFSSLEIEYDTLSKDYEGLSGDYSMLESRFLDLSSRYESLSSEYDALLTEYQSLSSEYNQLIKAYDSLESEYNTLTSQYETIERELEDTTVERDRINAELYQSREELEHVTGELEKAEYDLEQARNNQVQLAARIEQLMGEQRDLEDTIRDLWTGLEGMLGGNVVFRTGEIILSQTMEAGADMETIHNKILSFLMDANTIALERGAQIEDDRDSAIWFDRVELEKLYDEISEMEGKAVVRMISATNTVLGDPVWAYFQVFPDEKIFSESEVIVSRTIADTADGGLIQAELFSMLAEVNSIAISRGMATDYQGTVGRVISMTEFQTAIGKIVDAGTPVTVSIVATKDTYRAMGPLDVQFLVELED